VGSRCTFTMPRRIAGLYCILVTTTGIGDFLRRTKLATSPHADSEPVDDLSGSASESSDVTTCTANRTERTELDVED
jgi:hypothetical protein